MNLYYSKSLPDEEGIANEAKSAIIFANKDELLKICDFFEKVTSHLKTHDNCHMHLCDYMEQWDSETDFDIEVNLENK